MKRWKKVTGLLTLALVLAAGLNYGYRQSVRKQAREARDRQAAEQTQRTRAEQEQDLLYAGCPTAGRLDRIVPERVGTGDGTLVQGWLIAPRGGAALRIDGRENGFPIAASEPRDDVRSAFPDCKAATASGFSVRLPGDVDGESIQLVARTIGGVKVLEQQKFGVPRIRVEVDPVGNTEPDGRNILSGWAISADGGPVTMELVASGRVVARASATRSRTDAGVTFPTLPRAARSGFEARVPFALLPRGNYRLILRATSGNYPPLEIDGPLVRNDHPYGLALTLKKRARNPRALVVAAWLAHESGIRRARLTTSDGIVLGALQRQRNDVRFAALPNDLVRDAAPPLEKGGIWALTRANTLPAGLHRLQVSVQAGNGSESVVPAQLVLNERSARIARGASRTRTLAATHAGGTPGRSRVAAANQLKVPPTVQDHPSHTCAREPLVVFYPGGPGTIAGLGPQREAQSLRALVEGACVRVGMRVRVEYLRTTLGRARDYAFDPYFKAARVRIPGKSMTTAGLDEALQLAARHDMPLLVSLDGGVWADSAFAAPDWDVVDHLEEDESAVQWNQLGRSEKDDALADMPGATSQPQIARMMSLNLYNERFRAYKKRNLEAAVAHIVAHLKRHPRHAVWINLDSDNYINPWFKERQWYDYNPQTLRQFREWLTGTGPYASGAALSGEAASPTLDLAAINRLARATWASVADVDAPRGPLAADDPWYQLWIRFKRHLVARHYGDLADWACAAGLPADHIYTAVGIADRTVAKNFDDPIRGWNDQSGVSLAGGKPRCGHLGVVMYGPVTRNAVPAPSGNSAPMPAAGPALASVSAVDPAFGVIEFHPADLDFPTRLPTREEARQSLRNLLDAGARFVSPMWGMVASGQSLFPDRFHAYEAMEGTAFELELVRVLREWNAENSRPVSR